MASKKKTQRKAKSPKGKKPLPITDGISQERLIPTKKPWLEKLILSFLIIFSAFILYSPTVDYSLVYCDDNIFVERFTGDIGLLESLDTTVGTTFYRPLLNASFIIDHRMALRDSSEVNESELRDSAGRRYLEEVIDPSVYHRSNILYHGIASVLVFLTLLILRFPTSMSFLFGLIFVAHPLLTPAASWISGRNDSLVTITLLFTFMSMIFYFDSKNVLSRSIWFVVHVMTFGLSLFTKEISVVFPAIGFAFIFFYKKRKFIDPKKYLVYAGWMLMSIIWYSMREAATSKIKSPDSIGLDPLITNFPTIPSMIGKVFFPFKMIALSSFETFTIASGVVITIVLLVFLFKQKKNFRSISLFGLVWFFAFLVPTLMIRIIYVEDFFDYAEHRAYLPMLGLIIFIGAILSNYKIKFKKSVPLAIMIIIISALSLRSFSYQSTFENRTRFWEHMVKMYPEKSRGYYDCALAYRSSGDEKKAESSYLKALERNPRNQKIYFELLTMYQKREDLEKVEFYARKLQKVKPGHPVAHYFIGYVLLKRDQAKEAIPHLRKALTWKRKLPGWFIDLARAYNKIGQYDESNKILNKLLSSRESPKATFYLGINFFEAKDYKKANEYFQAAFKKQPRLIIELLQYYDSQKLYGQMESFALQAKKLFPKDEILSYYLGRAYHYNGKIDLAVSELSEAVKKNEKIPDINLMLGRALLKQKKTEEAITCFNNAIKINPNYGESHLALGTAKASQEDYPAAEKHWKKALVLNPEIENAYVNLMRLYFAVQKDRAKGLEYLEIYKKKYNKVPKEIEEMLNN